MSVEYPCALHSFGVITFLCVVLFIIRIGLPSRTYGMSLDDASMLHGRTLGGSLNNTMLLRRH